MNQVEKVNDEVSAGLPEPVVPLSKTQAFFDELVAERNRPHCGDQWKAMVDGLTRRAQQRGLWSPPEPPKT